MIGTRQIHDAIDDQRRELGAAPQITGRVIAAQRVGPHLAQATDVLGIDLRQRRVTRSGQIAVIGRPVGGLGLDPCHLGMQDHRCCCGQQQQDPVKPSQSITQSDSP